MARILVVDDEAPVRKVLRTMLERAGYDVEDAPNGSIALEVLRDYPADVVITDIVMPEKEGIEIIQEMRADYPDIKIIAISGGGQIGPESYLEMARLLGAHQTLSKPVDGDVLLGAVRELLETD
jgi:CheY-like chemotaxis protein